MKPFDMSWKEAFPKLFWEKEKMLVTSIFFFSKNVFYSIKDRNDHYVTFILSSANAFNLDKVRFLSSGNGLKQYLYGRKHLKTIESIS